MTFFQVEENNEKTTLVFREKKPSQGALMVLRILIFISFIFPIIAILSVGLELATLFGIVIFIFIGAYFLRIYLWNTRGKEIIEIDDKEIRQTFHYGLTVDFIKSLENEKIRIGLIKENENIEKGEFENILDLDVELFQNAKALNLIFYNQDEEHLKVKAQISKQQAEEIMNNISKRINFNN